MGRNLHWSIILAKWPPSGGLAPSGGHYHRLKPRPPQFSGGRDLDGVKGAGAAGIVTISVGKTPGKNEFFRTHPGLIQAAAIDVAIVACSVPASPASRSPRRPSTGPGVGFDRSFRSSTSNWGWTSTTSLLRRTW